ncbi:Golgi reassembly stacking protein [Salix suchowensis]|nr:Golgi reassembly stacking protein [Salix suchowensis]
MQPCHQLLPPIHAAARQAFFPVGKERPARRVADKQIMSSLKTNEDVWRPLVGGQMEARPLIDNLLEYEALRCQGIAQLDRVCIPWVVLLNEAIASGNLTAITRLVADLVSGSMEMHRNDDRVLYAYLARVDSQMLGANEVYLLLHGLSNNPSAIRDIPLQVVEKLTLWLVGAPTGARMIGYRPPSIVYAAFRLIRRFMTSKNFDKRIIKLFRTLAQSRNIPSEAIQANDNHTNDIHYIVAAALLRASLHWGWKGLGSNILKELLQHRCRYPEHITILTVDALYSLMDTPSRDDVSACRSILAAFHHGVPNAVVPDGLIRQFYTHACEHNMPRSAESVYALSRSHSIANTHTYPPTRICSTMAHGLSDSCQQERTLGTSISCAGSR